MDEGRTVRDRRSRQAMLKAGEELEKASSLSGSAARGTLRLALKDAGYTPDDATPTEMELSIKEYMPNALRVRGVRNPAEVCRKLLDALRPFRRRQRH